MTIVKVKKVALANSSATRDTIFFSQPLQKWKNFKIRYELNMHNNKENRIA